MRVLFSIEFNYKDKKYCGIVRVMEKGDSTEYHVRIMNSRLDRWLYGHHVFIGSGGQINFVDSHCPDKVVQLRMAVHASLITWLSNREPAAPVAGRQAPKRGDGYYVHSISHPKQ
jgi:hypothetical protein